MNDFCIICGHTCNRLASNRRALLCCTCLEKDHAHIMATVKRSFFPPVKTCELCQPAGPVEVCETAERQAAIR